MMTRRDAHDQATYATRGQEGTTANQPYEHTSYTTVPKILSPKTSSLQKCRLYNLRPGYSGYTGSSRASGLGFAKKSWEMSKCQRNGSSLESSRFGENSV